MIEDMTPKEIYDNLARLKYVIEWEDIKLTPEEKRAFGEILADNMDAYDYNEEIKMIGDIDYDIDQCYEGVKGVDVLKQYVKANGYETTEEMVEYEGLPVPNRADMVKYLIDQIDRVEWIQETYEDVVDFIPAECEFNLTDYTIVDLFQRYVPDPDEEDDE